MFVTDPSFRRLAAYTPGSQVLLNAYNIGTFPGEAVAVTDSSGATRPAPIVASSTHSVSVQLPSSVPPDGAYFEPSSGGARYFGAFFADTVDSTPASNGCTYSLSPSSTTLASTAGTAAVLVVTQVGCPWQILDSDSFVTPGPGGTGTGVAQVSLAANVASSRSTSVEIAGQTVLLTQADPINGPRIVTVVSSASYLPPIAPGSWITITGSNLSATTRTWTSEDFLGNGLPVQLDGVSVTVNGLPAFVYYISPGQLNVLAPDDPASGPASVQVSNALGASVTFTVNRQSASPALFLFTAMYPAALHLTGQAIGSPGLIAGRSFSPAAPGETIELFGTGFGPTTPPTPSANIIPQELPLASQVSVTVGGQPAPVLFAGLVGSGLVQLNVTLPSTLADGDAPIVASIAGAQTQGNLFLTIHH